MSLVLDAIWSRLTDKPFNLEFGVTRNCNSHCLMCDQWKLDSRNELTFEEITKIFQSYQNWKLVGITGGEPSLRDDLSQIISVINATQPNLKRIFITTNGYLTKKIYNDIAAALNSFDQARKHPLLTVLVSIDGPTAVHNRIRGLDSAYQSATKTLSWLSSLQNSYRFNLGTVSTYGPFNYKEYDAVLQELEHLKTLFNLEPAFCLIWFGNLYDTAKEYSLDYLEALKSDRWKIMSFLNKGYTNLLNARGLFWEFSKDFIEDQSKQVLPCQAARIRYFLDAYGNIYPCVIWNNRIASLRCCNYDFNYAFKMETRYEVEEMIQKVKCPVCYLTCEFIPTMMAQPLRAAWKWL